MQDFYYMGEGSKTYATDRLWNMKSGTIGADIETHSLEDRTPLGLSLAFNRNESVYFPIDSSKLPWHILENPNIQIIFHNGHFDLGVLDEFLGRSVTSVVDTCIAAQLIGLPPSLAALAEDLYDVKWDSIPDLIGIGKAAISMSEVPIEKIANKCNNDAKYTFAAWEDIRSRVPPNAFQLEMQLLPVLMPIEKRGMRINIEKLIEHRAGIKKDVDYYRNIAENTYGFNPGSSVQVAAIMQSRGWPIKYSKKGKPVMNKQMLTTFYAEDPLAQLTLLYRSKRILLSTFIDAVLNKHLKGDRTYGRINQNVAQSGRLTRTKPNLQNIPTHMRDVYIASEGCYLEAHDLSQIELRVLAYLVWQHTGDKTMQTLFDNGVDIHDGVQQKMGLKSRTIAKALNFLIPYGGDANTAHMRLGIPIDTAQNHIDNFFTQFPGVLQYISMVHADLAATGYVETLLGRQRHFAVLRSNPQPWQIAAAMREGFNTVIQGSAAEYLKRWQVRQKDQPQINTIHDEILFDVPFDTVIPNDQNIKLAEHDTPASRKRGPNWKDLVVA